MMGGSSAKLRVQTQEVGLENMGSDSPERTWVAQAVRSLGCFKWGTFSCAFFGTEIMGVMCKMNHVREG